MEAGTSCAIATRPTSKITVANIISRMLKPPCGSRSFVDECRIPCLSMLRMPASRFSSRAPRQEPSRSVLRLKEAKPQLDTRTRRGWTCHRHRTHIHCCSECCPREPLRVRQTAADQDLRGGG